jgi:lysophospholipase L1-like esterase
VTFNRPLGDAPPESRPNLVTRRKKQEKEMSIRPTALIAAAVTALVATLATGSAASASSPSLATRWSASWTSAMQQPVASSPALGENWSMDGFSSQTVRQEVRVSGGGSVARIRLSNLYGTEPLRIAEATISTVGANDRYTDALAERLLAVHSPRFVANAGITGNLLLHQLSCFGETGITRFQRDALGQPGVRTVILMEGSNDIWDSQASHGCGTTPAVTAGQIIDGFQALIHAAHARGIRVIGATILPFKADVEPPADFQRAEAIREAVNNWILSSGQYDAVADFAAAVADPDDPRQLNPSYNSGDHFHPNDAGYRAIAGAINIGDL